MRDDRQHGQFLASIEPVLVAGVPTSRSTMVESSLDTLCDPETRGPGPAPNNRALNGGMILEFFTAEQRLFRVLRRNRTHWVGPAVFFELDAAATSTDDPNVAQITARIILDGLDLYGVVWRDGMMPVEPDSPSVGHDVRHLNVDDAGPFPVASPPGG